MENLYSRWPDGERQRIPCPNNCGITFLNRQTLCKHNKAGVCKNFVEKPVEIRIINSKECKFCKELLPIYKQRRIHYYKKHSFCTNCDTQLGSRDKLLKHLKIEHDHKVQCEFCQYSSIFEHDVKTHIKRLHTGEYKKK